MTNDELRGGIVDMVIKCNDRYWLKVIYTYVKNLIG